MRELPREAATGLKRLLVVALGLGLLGGLAATAVAAYARATAAVPAPRLSLSVPARFVPAPGDPPPIVVPPRGSLDLEADVGGRLAAREPDVVRPIASVAKAMTALVVVEAHPLGANDEGPTLTMTSADVALYHETVAQGGSAVPVRAGERFTERQALLALLLPSANNLAVTLGRWVSGSDAAFVARLNAEALRLGMENTHFADAAGFDPATVSTAADLVRLGRAVLAEPALAAIVATPEATLPDGTVVHNLDTLVGSEPGWLGIKTGDTAAAGGCLLFAARDRPFGSPATAPPVTVVGAVLGQTDRFAALDAARSAVRSALAGYVAVDIRHLRPSLEGTVGTAWGETTTVSPGAGETVAKGPTLTVRRGMALALEQRRGRIPAAPLRRGAVLGDNAVVALLDESTVARWPLVVDAPLDGPSLWWRLVHG